MSIAVICDKCDERINSEDNRVTVTATRYTLVEGADDADPQVRAGNTPVPGAQLDPSMPPGTVLAAPGTQVAVLGSSRPFTARPAFDGELTMHEKCWDNWIARSKGFEQVSEEGGAEESQK